MRREEAVHNMQLELNSILFKPFLPSALTNHRKMKAHNSIRVLHYGGLQQSIGVPDGLRSSSTRLAIKRTYQSNIILLHPLDCCKKHRYDEQS